MTDQDELRRALQDAVPEPPWQPDRGPSARLRARRPQRRRLVAVGTLVSVLVATSVAVALQVNRDGGARHQVEHHPSGPLLGQGAATCRRLDGQAGLGRSIDSRTVDGATAATWLHQTDSDLDPARFSPAPAVTACVMNRRSSYTVVLVGPDHQAVKDVEGGPHTVSLVMAALDRLWTGGAGTTEEPFRCPGPSTPDPQDVTTVLPTGATAARICFEGGTEFTPSQVLTTGVDELVRSINDAPLSFTFPDEVCGGTPFSYGYTIVFQYPSGTRSVSSETCRGLVVGPYTREPNGPGLDQVYLDGLQRQLGTTVVTPPACPAAQQDAPSGLGDLRHVVAARFCPSGSSGLGQVFTATELTTLQAWGRTLDQGTSEIEGPCSRPAGGWAHLALTDAWHNRYTVTLKCSGMHWMIVNLPSWPSGQARRTLFLDQPLPQLLEVMTGDAGRR